MVGQSTLKEWRYFFSGLDYLEVIDLSQWDPASIIDMSDCFTANWNQNTTSTNKFIPTTLPLNVKMAGISEITANGISYGTAPYSGNYWRTDGSSSNEISTACGQLGGINMFSSNLGNMWRNSYGQTWFDDISNAPDMSHWTIEINREKDLTFLGYATNVIDPSNDMVRCAKEQIIRDLTPGWLGTFNQEFHPDYYIRDTDDPKNITFILTGDWPTGDAPQ